MLASPVDAGLVEWDQTSASFAESARALAIIIPDPECGNDSSSSNLRR